MANGRLTNRELLVRVDTKVDALHVRMDKAEVREEKKDDRLRGLEVSHARGKRLVGAAVLSSPALGATAAWLRDWLSDFFSRGG